MTINEHIILIGGLSNLHGALPTITNCYLNSAIMQENFSFFPHYSIRTNGIGQTGAFNLNNIIQFIKDYRSWVYMLAKYKPDVAHYPVTSYWNLPKSIIFLMTAKIFRCKSVGHLHGGAFDDYWDSLSTPVQYLSKLLLDSLDGMIVLGQKWENLMNRIISDSKIFILPNPIDEKFSTHKFPPPFKSQEINLFFIGSIGERKGVPVLLQAINYISKNNNNIFLNIFGTEEKLGGLKKMQNLAGELISDKYYSFKGPIYGDEKIKHFSENDIFVFPSNNENFPLVVIEAMAASRPIICTPVGAIPEYLEHGVSALFVKPQNPEDLAEKIIWMINHPYESKEMGKKARKIYDDRLVHEVIMKELKYIYLTILNV